MYFILFCCRFLYKKKEYLFFYYLPIILFGYYYCNIFYQIFIIITVVVSLIERRRKVEKMKLKNENNRHINIFFFFFFFSNLKEWNFHILKGICLFCFLFVFLLVPSHLISFHFISSLSFPLFFSFSLSIRCGCRRQTSLCNTATTTRPGTTQSVIIIIIHIVWSLTFWHYRRRGRRRR